MCQGYSTKTLNVRDDALTTKFIVAKRFKYIFFDLYPRRYFFPSFIQTSNFPEFRSSEDRMVEVRPSLREAVTEVARLSTLFCLVTA